MKDRLQFKHHDHIFATRDEAVQYIKDYAATSSLYAEPVVVKYKNTRCDAEEEGPNVIVGIGSIGKGDTDETNRIFLLDLGKYIDDIENLQEQIDAISAALTLTAIDTNTVDMTVTHSSGGTTIKSEVKLEETHRFDGEEKQNIIKAFDNGLFTYVNLSFDPETGIIRFYVNGGVTKYTVPIVTGGIYSPEDDAIHINMSDGSVKDIDMSALEQMFFVEKNPNSPIVLKKERQDDGSYLVSGEIRIASSGIVSDNILEVTDDNRYLFVNGLASNIKCWNNGQKMTVQEALNAVDTKISTDSKNIIYKNVDGGIFAAVRLDYNPAKNEIRLITSGVDGEPVEYKYELSSTQILEDVDYDPTTQSIRMRFITANGEYKIIEIPMSEVIDEWTTDSVAHNVELYKQELTSGRDILTADVKISEHEDNILEDVSHTLFVKGTADNIKYSKDATVKDKLDAIAHDVIALSGESYFEVESTPTVSMTKSTGAEHTVKANVNISNSFDDNIISKDDNGIFARFNYDNVANAITVSNGNSVAVYKLANSSTLVKNVEYDYATEELVLTYNDDGKLRLPMGDIANEWSFRNSGHTVSFERTRAVSGSSVVTADVNISLREDNMIKTVEEPSGGKAIYVSSAPVVKNAQDIAALSAKTSDNTNAINALSAKTDATNEALAEETRQRIAGDEGLQRNIDALSGKIDDNAITFSDTSSVHFDKNGNDVKASVKVSQNNGNIVRIVDDGVYTYVSLDYDSVANALKFKVSGSDEEKVMQLNAGSLLDSISYDPVYKRLVIKYKDASGTEHTETIDIADFFTELRTDNPSEDSAIELTTTMTSGLTPDRSIQKISARALLTNRDDNLVHIVNNGLYVSGKDVEDIVINVTSGDFKDLQDEIDRIEEGAGLNQDGTYHPNPIARFINSATSLMHADEILDQMVSELKDAIDGLLEGSETYSTIMYKDAETGKISTDVKLSHGKDGEMTDEDLSITADTDTMFEGFNVLRIAKFGRVSEDTKKRNGLYLSNIWDCGSYDDYDEEETNP